MSKFYQLKPDEWLEACKTLKPAELKVLYRLRSIEPFGNHQIKFKVIDIAKDLEMNKGTVSRAIQVLGNKGYINLEIVEAVAQLTTKSKKLCGDNLSIPKKLCTDNLVVYRQQKKLCSDHSSCVQTTKSCVAIAEVVYRQPDDPQSYTQHGSDLPKINKIMKINKTLQISEISEDEISEKNLEVKRQDSGFEIDKISEPSDQITERRDSRIETEKIPESRKKNSEVENSSLASTLAILKPKLMDSVIRDPETKPEVSDQEMRRRVEIFDQKMEQDDTIADLKAGSERTFSVKSEQIGDGTISPPSDIELFAFVKHEFESQRREMRNPTLYVNTAINRERAGWIKRWYESKRSAQPVETWKPTPFVRPDPEAAAKAIAEAKALLIKRNLYKTTEEVERPRALSSAQIESLREGATA